MPEINQETAKHVRRILKQQGTLSVAEITSILNHEVSAVDAYQLIRIEAMLKLMPELEEVDGKYRLKTREDVNQAAARIVRQATEH